MERRAERARAGGVGGLGYWLACVVVGFSSTFAAGRLVADAISLRPRSPQSSVIQALERYGKGEFDGALADLTQGKAFRGAIQQFRREAGDWFTHPPSEESGRRLAIVATVALDLVGRSVDGTHGFEAYRHDLRPLIEWTCALLRRGRPSEFERLFHLASIGLLQAAHDEELLIGTKHAFSAFSEPPQQHILHGASRFPQESRFKLAWITTRVETQVIASGPLSPGYLLTADVARHRVDRPDATKVVQQTLDALGLLVNDEAIGHEVKLRRGVMRFTIGQAGALEDLRDASKSTEPFIQYLSNMMLGLLDERTGRAVEAIEHYRAAVRIVPATAASLTLGSALFRQGRGTDAVEIVSAWASAPRPDDPWRLYGLGDYRLFPGWLAQMRQMIAR